MDSDNIIRTIKPSVWGLTVTVLGAVFFGGIISLMAVMAIKQESYFLGVIFFGFVVFIIVSACGCFFTDIEITERGFTYDRLTRTDEFHWDKITGVYFGMQMYYSWRGNNSVTRWIEIREVGYPPRRIYQGVFAKSDLYDLIKILRARAPKAVIDPRVIEFCNSWSIGLNP